MQGVTLEPAMGGYRSCAAMCPGPEVDRSVIDPRTPAPRGPRPRQPHAPGHACMNVTL